MRTDLRCKQCQTRLSVKVELQGKSIRCPKCSHPVRVTLAPVVLPPVGASVASSTPKRAMPVDDEPMLAEVIGDEEADRDFDVLPDEAPAAPVNPASTPALDEGAPRKRKKKKSKKKLKASEEMAIPAWMLALGILGALITTAGLIIGLYLALRLNTPDGEPVAWKEHLLMFGINLPITLVILILSMFISSALGGGINFGDAKTAIIGSIFLIVIVNLVNLIPVAGRYLTLLVWLIGFMTIFGLDPWEARFLLFINWLMNYAIGFALFHYMANKYDLGDEDDERPVRKKARDRNKIEKEDPDDPDPDGMGYYRPSDWHDRIGEWIERQRRVAA